MDPTLSITTTSPKPFSIHLLLDSSLPAISLSKFLSLDSRSPASIPLTPPQLPSKGKATLKIALSPGPPPIDRLFPGFADASTPPIKFTAEFRDFRPNGAPKTHHCNIGHSDLRLQLSLPAHADGDIAISLRIISLKKDHARRKLRCWFCVPNVAQPDRSQAKELTLDQTASSEVAIPIRIKLRDMTDEGGWLADGTAFVFMAFCEADARARDDPPRHVGYVGLKNQGATCYMNSMLQSFFFTPAFRRFVFEIPTTGLEDVAKSIPLCLQRLFALMQLGDKPCSTAALTTSFGWQSEQTFVQHDVLEFCRVLMDNLETKMKGTPLDGAIAGIFRGRWRKCIRAADRAVPFRVLTEQYFYDLPLQVRGCSTLQRSFRNFVEVEVLDGDNQYRTDDYGLQDAEMSTEFLEFPSVLHLQLSRWEYDQYGRSVKINDPFEFPPTIDLAEFLAPDADRTRSSVYDLYGVLVHSGGVAGGHYYAFLRPTQDGQWFEFNDTVVSPVTPQRAVNDNYGGSSTTYAGGYSYERTASGYMLVYVRKEDAPIIFTPIDESLIPAHLRDYVQYGDAREAKAAGGTIEFEFASEECIRRNAANGKVGWAFKELHRKASFTTALDSGEKVYQTAAELFAIPLPEVRIWTTYSQFIPYTVTDNSGSLIKQTYYLQLLVQRKPESEPAKTGYDEVVYFIKFFHPSLLQPLQYIGTHHGSRRDPIAHLFPVVARRLGFPEATAFLAFEELSTTVKKLAPTDSHVGGYAAAAVIFQLPPGTPLPATSYEWATPQAAAAPAEPAHDAVPGVAVLPVRSYKSDAADMVDSFLKNTIEAVVLKCDDPTVPICRITFPSNVTMSQFKPFIASVFGVPYDPAVSSMSIYKKDRTEDKPDTVAIREYQHYGLSFEFSANVTTEYRLWVQLNPAISEAQAATRQLLSVEYQASADALPTSHRVLGPKDASSSDFSAYLVQSRVIADAAVKTYRIYDHKIDRILKNSDRIYSTDVTVFVAHPDVLAPAEGYQVIKGCHAVVGQYLRCVLSPFFVKVNESETIPDFVGRMKQFLEVSDVEYKKLRFMLATQYAQYSPQAVLKGDKTMGEAIAAVSKTSDVYLFVLHTSDKKTNTIQYRDQSLKIFN